MGASCERSPREGRCRWRDGCVGGDHGLDQRADPTCEVLFGVVNVVVEKAHGDSRAIRRTPTRVNTATRVNTPTHVPSKTRAGPPHHHGAARRRTLRERSPMGGERVVCRLAEPWRPRRPGSRDMSELVGDERGGARARVGPPGQVHDSTYGGGRSTGRGQSRRGGRPSAHPHGSATGKGPGQGPPCRRQGHHGIQRRSADLPEEPSSPALPRGLSWICCDAPLPQRSATAWHRDRGRRSHGSHRRLARAPLARSIGRPGQRARRSSAQHAREAVEHHPMPGQHPCTVSKAVLGSPARPLGAPRPGLALGATARAGSRCAGTRSEMHPLIGVVAHRGARRDLDSPLAGAVPGEPSAAVSQRSRGTLAGLCHHVPPGRGARARTVLAHRPTCPEAPRLRAVVSHRRQVRR